MSKQPSFDDLERDFEERAARARAMGGEGKLARRKASGTLNARERIDHLADPGSFTEFGLFAQSSGGGGLERFQGVGCIELDHQQPQDRPHQGPGFAARPALGVSR